MRVILFSYPIFFLCLFFAHSLFPMKVLFLGDSLTEGYGIPRNKAYPALLQKKRGGDFKAVNAGISGSTSASALGRLKWALKGKGEKSYDLVVLGLGANDFLRALSPEATKKNLQSAIDFCLQKEIPVLLLGMRAPPNLGMKYSSSVEKIYEDIQRHFQKQQADKTFSLMPFMLEGVAGHQEYNLSDGLHPNEKGHEILAEKIEPYMDFFTLKKD